MNHNVQKLENRLRRIGKRSSASRKNPSVNNRWWLRIFVCAVRGFVFVIWTQRNMKIHLAAAAIMVGSGLYFKISKLEWMALCFSIALVLMAEMINTAVEVTVDLVTKKTSVRAMIAKDVAAGAVLILALNAIVVGSLIFWDRAYTLLIGG